MLTAAIPQDVICEQPFSLDYRIAQDLLAMISYRELVQEQHQVNSNQLIVHEAISG